MKALNEANKLLKGTGIKIINNKEWNEYIVKQGKDTYHTDDLQDAIDTAKVMAKI